MGRASRTGVVVTLSRYEVLLESLQEILGRNTSAAEQLTSQIREVLDRALEEAHVERAHVEIDWKENGGFFLFNSALQASRFGAAVQQIASERNREEKSLAQRHFKITIVTGDEIDRAIQTRTADSRLPMLKKGDFLRNASYLEASAHTGEVILDEFTWEMLPAEEQTLYGSKDVTTGKNGRTYHFYRRREWVRAPWDRLNPSEAAALYIRYLDVHNAKGIEKAYLVFADTMDKAPGWYVLAGGNGSGKSTLLRAIAAASVGRPINGLLDPSWIKKGSEWAKGEVVFISDSEASRSGFTVDTSDPSVFLRDPAAATLLEAGYLSGYGPFKRLGGPIEYVEKLSRSDDRLARVLTLFLDEAALWEVPQWLLRTDLGTNGGARKRSILSLLNSGLLPEGFAVRDFVEDDLLIDTPDGSTIPLRSTSDGLRCMLAMVLDILRGLEDCFGEVEIDDGIVNYPGLILIDEPDNHLHVLWQIKLASWMKEHFPRIQFIVASHSPFICVGADKIWRLDDESGAIVPRELPEEEMKELWNGSVSAILESDAFRVFNTLAPEAQDRHQEYLKLHRLSLQGRRLTAEQQSRLDELEQEIIGPVIPRDPEFDKLFP